MAVPALPELVPLHDGEWTTDDLDRFPESTYRIELLDGALYVPPTPTSSHQSLAMRLGVLLERLCPPALAVTQAVEVRATRRRSFVPDVLVITSEADARAPSIFMPDEVVLAVEVVSPSSRSMDAVVKPSFYAEAGIPHYWRLDPAGGLVLHTHRLDSGSSVYVESGRFDAVVTVDEPWPLTFDLASLRPRR